MSAEFAERKTRRSYELAREGWTGYDEKVEAEMEKEEAERLENARKAIVAEQEKLRLSLHEKEKELERLKKTLGD